MAAKPKTTDDFNVFVIGQAGRLQYEALLFAASVREFSPNFKGRLIVAEPQPGPLWPRDPRMDDTLVLEALNDLDVEIIHFESKAFGNDYAYGNKIEALTALPKGKPFVFFDTDTLITDELTSFPFNFNKPSASLKREGTWPTLELYGPGYGEIWK